MEYQEPSEWVSFTTNFSHLKSLQNLAYAVEIWENSTRHIKTTNCETVFWLDQHPVNLATWEAHTGRIAV
jgi:hypothetical protein